MELLHESLDTRTPNLEAKFRDPSTEQLRSFLIPLDWSFHGGRVGQGPYRSRASAHRGYDGRDIPGGNEKATRIGVAFSILETRSLTRL
jgi:hypothetical protein